MPDHEGQFGPARYGHRFPLLRIFDCAQISLSPASVLIATLAVVLLQLLGGLVDYLLPVSKSVVTIVTPFMSLLVVIEESGEVESLLGMLTSPWQSLFRPLALMLTPSAEFVARFNGLCRFALSLSVWSLGGLILCRRSSHLFSANDESTFVRAVRYSLRRWIASVGAPLIPLAAAVVVGLMSVAIGLLGRLPYLGGPWLLVASPFLAAMGFVIAFLLLATAIGWPLMVASVATDDCDSFGGLSRAYSSVTGRPWLLVLYATLGILVGLIVLKMAALLGNFVIWCTMACTAPGSGHEQANAWLLPSLTQLIHEIVKGVAVSYFWSAAVVTYLLLRLDVDGVPMSRVAPDDESRPVRDPYPVVGIPAVEGAVASNGEAEVEE